MVKRIVIFIVCSLYSYTLLAAPSSDLWPVWEESSASVIVSISHKPWGDFLERYLSDDAKGNRLVDYGKVTANHHQSLKAYIDSLESIMPRQLTRDQQFAYWVNLYNAVTVDLILDNYPLKSITKLGGFFSFGPWDKKLIRVAGHDLSLNDIEHRILRPIWKDNRIHYVVNCASLGCPNLQPTPYSATELEVQLDNAAREFINSEKGVMVEGKGVILSEIYNWYAVDFGTLSDLENHFKKYLTVDKAKRINLSESIDYAYDWSLNDAR